MSDAIDERLSAFLDGELHEREHDALLQRLQHDRALQARWERFQIISDAMRNNLPAMLCTELRGRVSEALADEPNYLLPKRRGLRLRSLAKQAAGLAIAATIAGVAIVAVDTGTNDTLAPNEVATSIGAAAPTSVVTARPVAMEQWGSESPAVRSRLSSYLVNHYEYSVASGMQGMMPYMRIVSYPTGAPLAHENR